MADNVILVDQDDNEIGVEEKQSAHEKGKLHRAFSVYVFNSRGELCIQRRAETKYHSGALWTNTCDGHPRVTEQTEEAARRRLREEMGLDCELQEVFHFTYRAELDNGLVEHELNHVLIGRHDADPTPDPAEVSDWKWISLAVLHDDMRQSPGKYAPWFTIPIDRLDSYVRDWSA